MITNKTHRLLLGVFLLLLVDVIWVGSSELTKFLYENESFDKPFFCTYFKTSMFTFYLVVLGLIAPWKESCGQNANNNYTLMDQNLEDDSFFASANGLSDSTFVPIKTETISGTESDESSIRSVRFSKLAEVREMSPHEAGEALMSRLSYSASIRVRRQKTNHKTARTALMFCVLWFIANYLFQLALEPNETAIVTLLSSTSSFFVLILAAAFPSSGGDKLTLSKCCIVLISFAGVITVTISDIDGTDVTKGIVLALLSAFFYAAYLVLVKHKSDTEEKIDIPLFFGFVGLWNLLLMWPVFFVLNFTQIETFELPNKRQFVVLFLNGFVGTVLSEAIWLWACFLTSSLTATIAVTLQIPLAILADVIFKDKEFPLLFYMGSLPMCLSLILVAILVKNEDSDPLLRFFKIIYRKACHCRRASVVRIPDLEEQHESLIDSHDN
ncbi:solute carrier family 35 member F5 isoform X2 [Bradysia coprophila]|uniref:solute carrier family 35 member F5 isoform X2 n=1 Tax=Bradysia coprophila TaxID=38358 RepID=UPI00187D8BEA|nr:solute carrier family 35 member F5 isoform X2 [Bradysia coprophila]XP_037042745.1 solute carrier family 35 member F5 isoform X2 [Bradysia coprophila]